MGNNIIFENSKWKIYIEGYIFLVNKELGEQFVFESELLGTSFLEEWRVPVYIVFKLRVAYNKFVKTK